MLANFSEMIPSKLTKVYNYPYNRYKSQPSKYFFISSRALFVDQGGTLIPWMGDKNQPIDRYDGRATIHNLSPFEAPKQELEPNAYLTTEEVSLSIVGCFVSSRSILGI